MMLGLPLTVLAFWWSYLMFVQAATTVTPFTTSPNSKWILLWVKCL